MRSDVKDWVFITSAGLCCWVNSFVLLLWTVLTQCSFVRKEQKIKIEEKEKKVLTYLHVGVYNGGIGVWWVHSRHTHEASPCSMVSTGH